MLGVAWACVVRGIGRVDGVVIRLQIRAWWVRVCVCNVFFERQA